MIDIRLISQRLNIRELQDRVGSAAEKALETVSEKIVDTAKQLVPVDTGNLKESIHFEGQGASKQLFAEDYAIFVETGTSRMSPHPFITPAVKSVSNEDFTSEVKKELR